LLLLAEESVDVIDMKPWHALQAWIRCGQYEVAIPFAQVLLDLVPPVAVRLRRDIKAVLNLIKVHTILHQASRERDSQGRIVATMDDYAVVRDLIADLISEGVEATVPTIVRETVKAVAQLIAEGSEEVSQAQVRKVLNLDRGATSRRVAAAIQHGYLKNREDRKGRPHRLVLGEPLQEDITILPSPEAVLQRCTVDGGDITPSPYSSTDLRRNDEPEREILAL
jgi:hypothetical protein